jgi:hypothetical protein
VARVHVRVCVPLVAVCPMRAALLGVACLRVFVWPLSISLVGLGVWYAVEVRPAGYRERCAGACRCVYYCLIVLLGLVRYACESILLQARSQGQPTFGGRARGSERDSARTPLSGYGHVWIWLDMSGYGWL